MIGALLRRPRRADFPGGLRLAPEKERTRDAPIRPGPLPAELILPLVSAAGAPPRPLVSRGDRVLRGQPLTAPESPLDVPLHAPASGQVVAIEPRPVQHPSGMHAPCIVLAPDGRQEGVDFQPLADWRQMPRESLLARIREAGITGLGGGGFPSAAKLASGHAIRWLLINGAECEPRITADERLMRERADEIIAGIEILQHLLQPESGTRVGIEDDKPEALEAMHQAAEGTDIVVEAIPARYPSGGERQLTRLLTGTRIASGARPVDQGMVCLNVASARAVYRAVVRGEPLLSRITTLTGDAVRHPGNYEVLLGTPVAALLEHGGIRQDEQDEQGEGYRLLLGGPVSGVAIRDPDVPLLAGGNAVIAAGSRDLPPPGPEQPCIRCGECAEVCPEELLPQQLFHYSRAGALAEAREYALDDCIECGACNLVCPSSISLVEEFRAARRTLRQQEQDAARAEHARRRYEARQQRLAREREENEARRRRRRQATTTPATATAPRGETGTDSSRALRAAWKRAHKQWKEAEAALERARRQQDGDTGALEARVSELHERAEQARTALDTALARETDST